jgi:hypothetical protein
MATIAFDSLSASKRLREAGMDERMANTVVELFQQTAGMPDISHLATKDDLKPFATKDDLKQFATKDDLKLFATKDDLKQLEAAAKADLQETKLTLRTEIAQSELRLSEKIRMQGWSLLGGMAVLLAFYTAMAKLIA